MNDLDILITDFHHPAFTATFQTYFTEMGIHVKNWDTLFDLMTNEKRNLAYLRLDEAGSCIGFLQFTLMPCESWFFTWSAGFIREFWVDSRCRSMGHGSALLALAEEYCAAHGAQHMILTSDTAPAFYKRHGYHTAPAIQAKNEMDVFIKLLE